MTAINVLPSYNSTSAAGPMHQVRNPLIVGVMLFSCGTSGAYSIPSAQRSLGEQTLQRTTSTGQAASLAVPAGEAIAELRTLSGLTWEQLARVMGVSRRSLHLWASGKALASTNEEKLARVLAVVRQLDRGTAAANRGWLLASSSEGLLPLDLLKDGAYSQVIALGTGPGDSLTGLGMPRAVNRRPEEALGSSPDELIGALQDRVHRDVGRVRPAKGVKSRSGV
jgi:transcriptional regulator with XRE-family HTH domain